MLKLKLERWLKICELQYFVTIPVKCKSSWENIFKTTNQVTLLSDISRKRLLYRNTMKKIPISN